MDLSIVIVNFRAWQDLRACLKSLGYLSNSATLRCEVIVVDNHSADGELTAFRRDFKWVQWLENPSNQGFASGCNLGAAKATGETLLFLNPDCVDHNQAISISWELARGSSQITGIQQQSEQGHLQKVGGQFPRWWAVAGPGRWVCSFARRLKLSGSKGAFQWITGAFLMISQRDFLALDGWDDEFFMYSEDIDLCRRGAGIGLRCKVLTQCSIIHRHGGSSRINRQVKALTRSEVTISRHRYIQKHLTGAKRLLAHAQVVLFEALPTIIISWLAPATAAGQRGGYLRRFYSQVKKTGQWRSPLVSHPPEL